VTIKTTLLLFALAASAASAKALTYEELLKAALASDPRIERLSIAERRSGIALDRAGIARDASSFSAESGELSAALSGSGAAISGSPSASYALPGGATIGLSIPFSASPSSSYAKPGLSAGIPILRGPDAAAAAAERARAAREDARRARARAELELEGDLVAALKATLDARAAVSRAAREEAKARREMDRAIALDGASPGGAAYMALDRALRSALRSRRDALAAEARALRGLRSVAGPSASGDAELVPASFPEPDMALALPAPSECYDAVRARERAALERLDAALAAPATKLSAELDAAYVLGDPSDAAVGPEFGAGARAAFGRSGIEIAAGAGWKAGSGPSARLSLSWKPPRRGDAALRSRDELLAEEERALSAADAERGARKALADMEERRLALAEAARDADEDLSAAEEQLEAYAAWRDRGLVGDAEYAEVLAARDECRSRAGSAVLERMAWSVEARLLSVPEIGGAR
jgi:hypothetical protein